MLNHGGKLNHIAQQYNIPLADWLDLSTGVSPIAFPVPNIPESVWRTLPQNDAELHNLAKRYYRAKDLIPLAGSQAGIQLLPHYRLKLGFQTSRVWLPRQGYKEHEKAWREAGFNICHYEQTPQREQLTQLDIVVVINPNNPTGQVLDVNTLLALQQRLVELSGWLVVDEAFMDSVGEDNSLVPYSHLSSVFVLRSMGKFFGLAGIRVGFICCQHEHLLTLNSMLGPWHISGPAGYVAKQALADREWQGMQKSRLHLIAEQLQVLLEVSFNREVVGTSLFKTVYLESASEAYRQLCQQGVYVRLTDEQDALRFGLPLEQQFPQLQQALGELSCTR